MERLFDSIMRQYPLPSLLIWKTKAEVRNRRFIQEHHEPLNLKPLYRAVSQRTKRLVLDGQQRLQTLYIGLNGSMGGRLLHLDLLSGEARNPEDVRYRFSFIDPERAHWPWVPLREIVRSHKLAGEIARELTEKHQVQLSETDYNRVARNLERAKREFENSERLIYHEIDSTDGDGSFEVEDIVEIFIRANAGGTKLSKSDLMFSLVVSDWHTADIEMQELLIELNGEQYDFDRDFVLKTAMVLLDQGAKYDVDKLRRPDLRRRITDEWDRITDSIRYIRDFLSQKTFPRCDKALPSYLALIPVIYFHYHFPTQWAKAEKDIAQYLLRVLLAGAFSGRPDGLIDKLTRVIRDADGFRLRDVFGAIREDGRGLGVSKSQLFAMGYDSRNIHLLFNLWHPRFDYVPRFDGHLPQVDHIFPRAQLKQVKEVNPDTGRMSLQVYSAGAINQLANCMLLTARENGGGGKSDKPLEQWIRENPSFDLELHCIPTSKRLWKLENYPKFIETRKKLLAERFADLLFEDDDSQ